MTWYKLFDTMAAALGVGCLLTLAILLMPL
jgi:hypothetical protein